MYSPTLSCHAASRLMPHYSVGALEATLADELIRHTLWCFHCRKSLWEPFQAQLNDSASALAEAVGGGDHFAPKMRLEMHPGMHPERDTKPSPEEGDTRTRTQQKAGRTWTDLLEASAEHPRELVRAVLTGLGEHTRLPDLEATTRSPSIFPPPPAELWLERTGLYLPRIPHPERIQGYILSLMSDGKVRAGTLPGGQSLELARLTVQEMPAIPAATVGEPPIRYTLEARVSGLELDGAPLQPREVLPLGGYHILEGHAQGFTLSLGQSDLPQTLGRIEILPERIPLVDGFRVIGRDPQADIPLPDGTPISPAHHLLLRPGIPWSAVQGISLENLEVSRKHAGLTVEPPLTRRQNAQGGGVMVTALSPRSLWHHGPLGWRAYAAGVAPFELKIGEILVVGRQSFRLGTDLYP